MNLDSNLLTSILRINGLSPQSPSDQIYQLLSKAGYTQEQVSLALAMLQGVQEPVQPNTQNAPLPITSNSPSSISSPSTVPQKSFLWIWTTLWLTTLFDAAVISLIWVLLLFLLKNYIPAGIVYLLIFSLGTIIAIAVGSYAACAYVFKRTPVMKTEAGKFAGLAILVPLIGYLIILGLQIVLFKSTATPGNISMDIGQELAIFSVMYLVIRSQLEKKGK